MEKSKIYKKLEDLKAEMHEPVATYGKPSETVQDVVADYVHIPEHTRSLSGSLLGYKTIP